MKEFYGYLRSRTALSGSGLDCRGTSDRDSKGGWHDHGCPERRSCAGYRNRKFSRKCRRHGGHLVCNSSNDRPAGYCVVDRPIPLDASSGVN